MTIDLEVRVNNTISVYSPDGTLYKYIEYHSEHIGMGTGDVLKLDETMQKFIHELEASFK